jgi:hypothetical protein
VSQRVVEKDYNKKIESVERPTEESSQDGVPSA